MYKQPSKKPYQGEKYEHKKRKEINEKKRKEKESK